MTYQLRDYQEASVQAGVSFLLDKKVENGIIVAPTGCHSKGTGIIMLNGSVKRVEEVIVGDIVMGDDNTPRIVLKTHSGSQEMFKITPLRGGSPFTVNKDHILSLKSTNEGNKQKCKSLQKGGEITDISIDEYLKKSKYWKHLRKLYRSPVVEFKNNQTIPIKPWLLGALIGDGFMGFNQLNLIKPDIEIVSRLKIDAAEYGIDAWSEWINNKNSYVVHFVKNNHKKGEPNPLITKLKEIGLFGCRSGNKFIPDCYKYGTVKDRLEILAGLMDTDGHLVNNSGYDYVSKSAKLARDIAFIARSLGFTVNESLEWKSCQTGSGDYYSRLHISGNVFKIPCVTPRKKAIEIKRRKNHLLTGFSVKSAGIGEYFGFTLDGNHRYLTDDFFIHHNCGKSLLASNIVSRLDAPCLIFQPTCEILEQNFEKFESYGERPAIYSASMGEKTIGSQITLATIGSVIKCREKFRHIKYIIQDECHIGSPAAGMYKDFYKDFSHCKLLGMSATPYRLHSNSLGSELRWITRTTPKIFNKVVSVIQIQDLAKRGYFAPLEYKQVKTGFNPSKLRIQKNGADYTDESVKAHFLELHFSDQIVRCVNRLFELGRRRVLVFTRFVEEAEYAASKIPGSAVVTGQTPKNERIRIISEFKSGKIPAVFNVGVLTCGFDYPELSNVILARPTMSLTLFYQMVGRCVRPHPSKSSAFVIDMVGLVEKFGRIEDLQVGNGGGNKWFIHSNGKQLTNVYFPR